MRNWKNNVCVAMSAPPAPPPPPPEVTAVQIQLSARQAGHLMSLLARCNGGETVNPLTGLYGELKRQGVEESEITDYMDNINLSLAYNKMTGGCNGYVV